MHSLIGSVGGLFGGEGLLLLLVLLVLAFLFVWPMWRVCAKAGFPGALGLLVLIPGGIVVLLFVLALVEWPALLRDYAARDVDVRA